MASTSYSREDRFQPSTKLLNRTAASGFSYLPASQQQQLQQRLPAARSSSHGGYNNPLPRQRPNNTAPTSLSHARRKMVNSALQDYLKSLNAMTRSIVLETETVEKENQCNWTKLDTAKKEDLMNDHFMPAGVRMQYDYERSASCYSFSTSWEDPSACYSSSYKEDSNPVMENRPLHLSQPNDWEASPSHSKQQLSRSSRDLDACDREDLNLSQPSLVQSYQEPATFDRLHKKQLSFRPSKKQHAMKPRQPPQQKYNTFRTQLGSDGEGQRTSDEDYEGANSSFSPPQNLLGFQRTKLRSYSMRSKKNSGGPRTSANLRSSVRTSNRIRTNPEDRAAADSSNQHCRPSHYHTYSTTSTETDFDEAIDMPDEALLLDHVSRKSSTEEEVMFDDDDDEYQSTKPKYSRTRRSLRAPKITLESEVHVNRNTSSTSFGSGSDFPDSSTQDGGLYRCVSRESLDLDSVSLAPSDASKYPMDDEESVTDQSRMTPDSTLSSYSCRPRSKNAELAVLRNRKGKRGGSSIKVATSDYADRHTQFKNAPKHQPDSSCQSSACTTRATSPASSVSSSPSHWHAHHQRESGGNYLKAPEFGFAGFKRDSAIESGGVSDLPCSPDHSIAVHSPPSTPLTVSYTAQQAPLLRKTLSSAHHEDRESGYMSSSSESFPVNSRH